MNTWNHCPIDQFGPIWQGTRVAEIPKMFLHQIEITEQTRWGGWKADAEENKRGSDWQNGRRGFYLEEHCQRPYDCSGEQHRASLDKEKWSPPFLLEPRLADNVPLFVGFTGEHQWICLSIFVGLPIEYIPRDNFDTVRLSNERNRFEVIDGQVT